MGSPLIGIDLGTTNCVVATVQDGQPTVIRSRSGATLTPSVVAIAPSGKLLVGVVAKRQAITNAENTVSAAKRLIGRRFSSREVQQTMRMLPYAVVAGQHDDVRVRLSGRDYAVPELSALLLSELRADAEAHYGTAVTNAVITVPAYFSDAQRQATKDAATIAGLSILRVLSEPTSAALAYGLAKNITGRIAVFDLGGGTFDISVLEVSSGVFQVLATGGDSFLGGEDFDRRVMEHLFASFEREHGIDLRSDKVVRQRVKEAAEKAKCDCSAAKEAAIHLPFLHRNPDTGGVLHLEMTLSRDKLEDLTRDLIDRCLETSKKTLEEAGVRPGDLKEVVLVGGMTRMPKVAERVRRFFGREPCKGVHPDEVVALGAAIQADALAADPKEAERRGPPPTRRRTQPPQPPESATSIERNPAPVPLLVELRDVPQGPAGGGGPEPGIDLPEASEVIELVDLAAPISGAVRELDFALLDAEPKASPVPAVEMPELLEELTLDAPPEQKPPLAEAPKKRMAPRRDVVLLEVTPMSLGIAVAGGYTKVLVPKNTTVPTMAAHLFHTSKDDQTTVRVVVLQGENTVALQNETLGEFLLTGLRKARRGEVEVEVTFEISADGIVSVAAKDTVTGKRTSITVVASGGLTREELQEILEVRADFELEAREGEELGNRRDEVGRLIREIEDRLPAVKGLLAKTRARGDVVERAEEQIARCKGLAGGTDLAVLVAARDELWKTCEMFRSVIQKLGGRA
jgi:molecular chaperone DnaK (HSP70)